jgi:hypothetical protein
MALADGGYQDGYEFFETPTGESNEDQRMKQIARARHETINRRMKEFGILQQQYTGDLNKHVFIFMCIANLTQFQIEVNGTYWLEYGGPETGLFDVEYYDRIDPVTDDEDE